MTFAKNPGAHFTLKIQTNQRFGTFASGKECARQSLQK